MSKIILSTLGSRYIHCAFGLRYLYANLGELQAQASIKEFTIHDRPSDIAEKLLLLNPKIIGFSLYIWNVSETTQVVALIKKIRPDISIVLGGPEVSHLPDQPAIVGLADYVIQGVGEISFKELAGQLLNKQRPLNKAIQGKVVALESLALPYQYYTDEDIRNRIIYVEASRGCPFKCEFCLSALDKTTKSFTLDTFLNEMDILIKRGARNFKFIDRTFNIKISSSIAIMEFFLERMTDDLYLHFEVVPDNLPDKLKEVLKRFPKNSLQFEIGIQTFDTKVQDLISRKQDNQKTKDNLRWLKKHTGAHLHADLIFGLPSDTLENFADSFDQLVELQPQEIQLGILKRLRGAPINRHSKPYKMCYSDEPPYSIISTSTVDFLTFQRIKRFARYWDIIANSGRFPNTVELLLANGSAFFQFLKLSDLLYQQAGSTWKIALPRLYKLLYNVLNNEFKLLETDILKALSADFNKSKQKGNLEALLRKEKNARTGTANKRQQNHL